MINLISVKNFKALKDVDLSINTLNVLSGINGVGKSSFIQVILLLKQTIEENQFENGLLLKGKYIDLGQVEDVYSESARMDEGITINIEVGDEFAYLNYTYSKKLNSNFLLPINRVKCEISKGFTNSILFQKRCSYLKSYRVEPQITYSLSSNLNEDEIGTNGEYVTQYLANNLDKDVTVVDLLFDKKDISLRTNVAKWLTLLSEEVQIKTVIDTDNEFSYIKYRFKNSEKDPTNWYSSLNVGAGFTSVLPVIVRILNAEKGDILIIENPEDQLHPKAQAILGFLFAKAANGGIQIFVETHSDHIINGVRVAVKNNVISKDKVGVLFFQREINIDTHQTKVKRLNIDDSGRIDEYPNDFLDEWDKQLDELLKD